MNEWEYNEWLENVVRPNTTAREREQFELLFRVARAKGLKFCKSKAGGFVHIKPSGWTPNVFTELVDKPPVETICASAEYYWPFDVGAAWRLLDEGGFTDYEIEKAGGLYHCTIEAAWRGEGQTPAEAICRAWLEWDEAVAMSAMMP